MTPTQAVERLVKASVHLSDADLDRTYAWEEYRDDGLRFALLAAHLQLRETAATVAAARLGAGKPFTEAQRILAQVHEAYRDLTGALAGASDAELDAKPPDEQWPLRQVLNTMQRKMALGDALIATLVNRLHNTLQAFVTWNAVHFQGRLAVPIFTPATYSRPEGRLGGR